MKVTSRLIVLKTLLYSRQRWIAGEVAPATGQEIPNLVGGRIA